MTTDANLKAALEASLAEAAREAGTVKTALSAEQMQERREAVNRILSITPSQLVARIGAGMLAEKIADDVFGGPAKRRWPDPTKFRYVTMPAGGRGYESDYFEGSRPGVTSVLKVLGLGTNGLIRWAANEERKAVLEAVEKAYTSIGAHNDGVEGFMASVDTELGPARAHQKILTKASDIGSQVHSAVQGWLQAQVDGKPEPSIMELGEEASVAVCSFQDWFRDSGLKPVRCEQPVFSESFAGTIDVVCEHPRLGLGIVDLKSGKYLYDEYHLQVAAYMEAGRNFADLQWAKILRLPKYLSDPEFEVRALGDLYEGRVLSLEQLQQAFHAALTCWKLLVAKG